MLEPSRISSLVVVAFLSLTRVGGAQVASHASHPSISPNGELVAFLSNRDGQDALYVMRTDGSDARRISANIPAAARPAWIHDGRSIVTSYKSGDTTIVVALDVATGRTTEITRMLALGSPVPFQDAAQFVYGVGTWAETQLEIVRADGSGRTRITQTKGAANWCPAVSWTGDRIAVGRRDTSGMQIWVMDIDGRNARQLTHLQASAGSAECPAWSPDGKRIAFQSGARVAGQRATAHIWLVDATTGEARELTSHAEPWQDEAPAWFPDGRRIAFQSNRTGTWEVWVIDADGRNQRQISK
jgi:TolB protein